MTSTVDRSFRHEWFPVVRCQEVGLRHIHRSQLLNQELAIWRDDEGRINAWENRCAHRGTRLSIGTNTGKEIKCQYHGWRYASQSGQCLFIPAHPDMTPGPRYCVNTYQCVERYGYVWVRLENEGQRDPLLPLPEEQSVTTLRSIHTKASTTRIREWLTGDCESVFQANTPSLEISLIDIQQRHAFLLEAIASNEYDNESVAMFIYLHPLTDEVTTIHPLVNVDIPHEKRLEELRRYNRLFGTIRNVIEADHVR